MPRPSIFPVGKKEGSRRVRSRIREHTDARIAHRSGETRLSNNGENRSRCLNVSRNSQVSCRMELSNGEVDITRSESSVLLYSWGKKRTTVARKNCAACFRRAGGRENEKGENEGICRNDALLRRVKHEGGFDILAWSIKQSSFAICTCV